MKSKLFKVSLYVLMIFIVSLTTTHTTSAAISFSDIKGHWAEGNIKKGVSQGITNGYPNGTFRPDNMVTVAEFSTFLFRGLGKAEEINNKPYPNTTIALMKQFNYPLAASGTKAITRFEVASIVTSAQGLNFRSNEDAVKYLLVNQLSNGKVNATVAGYKGADYLTRAEALTFINNLIESKVTNVLARPVNASSTTELEQKYQEHLISNNLVSSGQEQYPDEVVKLVNIERAKNNLQPLQMDKELSKVATLKSEDLYNKSYFDHISPTYGSPFDMMEKFGITFTMAGENIAAGQDTPADVVTAWMNSPGHRANILNKDFTHIGVGYYYMEADKYQAYWTQMFIKKKFRR